jgi:hypothetical protein
LGYRTFLGFILAHSERDRGNSASSTGLETIKIQVWRHSPTIMWLVSPQMPRCSSEKFQGGRAEWRADWCRNDGGAAITVTSATGGTVSGQQAEVWLAPQCSQCLVASIPIPQPHSYLGD